MYFTVTFAPVCEESSSTPMLLEPSQAWALDALKVQVDFAPFTVRVLAPASKDSTVPLTVCVAGAVVFAALGAVEVEEEAVLVARVAGAAVGLVVDRLREGIDVILKPLEGVLAGMRGYSGSALLGDGRVLLVLNLKELL